MNDIVVMITDVKTHVNTNMNINIKMFVNFVMRMYGSKVKPTKLKADR